MPRKFKKDWQYYKFCLYGFLKNQRFFDPFLILFFLEKGLDYKQIGILYSVRFLIRTVLEIPSGIIADAFGRKGIMLFSYLMYILSFPAYYFYDTFIFLLIPTTIFGIGDAFRTGTHKAMIVEYLKRNNWSSEKTDYYGHTRSWSQFGSAISAVLAGIFVIASGNYSSIFLYSIFPYVIGFGLLASYPKYLNGQDSNKSYENSKKLKNTFSRSYRILVNRKAIFSLTSVSLYSSYHMALKDYIQPMIQTLALSAPFFLYLNEKNRSAILISITYFVLYFISSRAAKNAGKLKSFLGSVSKSMNILMLIGLLSGVIAGLGSLFSLSLVSVLMFVIILAAENFRKPAGVEYLTNKFDNEISATVLSVESQFSSALAALLSLSVGILADQFSIGFSLLILSLTTLIFGVIFRVKPLKND